MVDQYVDVNGSRLAYRIEGAGPRLVSVHGLLSSRAAEQRSGHPLDAGALAQRHTLLRYDARSHGRSTGREVDAEHRWPALAKDLLGLLDTVDFDQVDAVGSSLGTATILWAATQAPQRFRRLVLLIPPTAWQSRPAQADFYRRAAALIEHEGAETFRELSREAPPPDILAGNPSVDFDPDVPDELLPSVLRGASESDLPDADAIAQLPHPTLILAWETDPGHPVATAERLAALLPHAELHISGTWPDVETWPARVTTFMEQPT